MNNDQVNITAAMLLVAAGIVAKRQWVTVVQKWTQAPVGSGTLGLAGLSPGVAPPIDPQNPERPT